MTNRLGTQTLSDVHIDVLILLFWGVTSVDENDFINCYIRFVFEFPMHVSFPGVCHGPVAPRRFV